MNSPALTPRDVIVGDLRREFMLFQDGEWVTDSPGGSALYAAAGYMAREGASSPGILAKVGEDYPQEWLERFSSRGFNLDGVIILPQALDLRSCIVHFEGEPPRIADPQPYLTDRNTRLPTDLVGYQVDSRAASTRQRSRVSAITEGDLPASYLAATGAHLCPQDYLTHNLLPAVLRQKGFSTITLAPDPAYMTPHFLGDIPALVTGLSAFIPTEESLLSLYQGQTADLWEIAADLGRYGCELIVIQRGLAGQYLYESASQKKWGIPGYPARIVNSYGAGDAFCGGFLAGFRKTHDPLEAAYYGSVAASLAMEGSSPLFALGALPGLAEARLEHIRNQSWEVS